MHWVWGKGGLSFMKEDKEMCESKHARCLHDANMLEFGQEG